MTKYHKGFKGLSSKIPLFFSDSIALSTGIGNNRIWNCWISNNKIKGDEKYSFITCLSDPRGHDRSDSRDSFQQALVSTVKIHPRVWPKIWRLSSGRECILLCSFYFFPFIRQESLSFLTFSFNLVSLRLVSHERTDKSRDRPCRRTFNSSALWTVADGVITESRASVSLYSRTSQTDDSKNIP